MKITHNGKSLFLTLNRKKFLSKYNLLSFYYIILKGGVPMANMLDSDIIVREFKL